MVGVESLIRWSYMFIQVVGFLCIGLVAALVLPKNVA
jgi:hypothetical protein